MHLKHVTYVLHSHPEELQEGCFQRSDVSVLSSARGHGRADSSLFSLNYEKVIVTVPSMLVDRAVFFNTCEVVFIFKTCDSLWPIYSMFMTL